MKLIKLTNNRFAQVDDDDYGMVSRYMWQCFSQPPQKSLYAIATVPSGNGRTTIRMHRLIMGFPKNKVVHHRDSDGLNNTKGNLLVCSYKDNTSHKRKFKKSSSEYKGVYFFKRRKTWAARIKNNYKSYYLGGFKNEIDAAKAYDKKARELFGEFALTNF